MKIALTTIGSRGDIQLYIALGVELQKNGHAVTLLTHPWAKKIVNYYGLAHLPVGDDIDINDAARQVVEHSSNNLKGFKFALNFIFDNLRTCHADLLAVLQDFDLVIGHGVVGEAEADMLGKPFIPVSIAPMGLKKEYWKSTNLFKELAVFMSDKIMGASFGKPYLNFRKDMGAPIPRDYNKYPYLALIPMPEFMQETNPNWKEKTVISGFLFADTPTDFSPPKELTDFLSEGKKPVLVTFGSMFHKEEQTKHLYKVVCDAIERSHSKAILIMPDLKESESPHNIYVANQIPYSWLLDKVALVVHHFGFGTTAEVLKAGLPSIPIPHIFDQNARAKQINKLGYACKPFDIRKMTADSLSDAIMQLVSNQEMKARCQEAQKSIINENGNKKAVELINQYIHQLHSSTTSLL